MEMHLQPLATTCFVSGEPFVEGARVASYLVRAGAAMEIVRYDLLEAHMGTFTPQGQVACRWVQAYKPRKQGENQDKALKLTAENLFVTLADPQTEPTPENTRLVQFLALMLERKKILRPKGRSKDGARNLFEHAKTKQIFEVPAGELTPEFFVAVQEQLSVLVGGPKTKADAPTAAGNAPAVAAANAAAAPASATPVGASPAETADTNQSPEAPSAEGSEAVASEPAAADASPATEGDSPTKPNESAGGSSGGTAAA